MFIENIIPMLIVAAGLMAIGSVALVQMVYGRKDLQLSIYAFVLMCLSTSTLSLKWLEGSGQIHSNQDNTSIFLFICLLLFVSMLFSRRFKGLK
ncbi:MAG: hypothetical protein OEX03_04785 [Gammaproteobacteria bacterium]|nr:hypothetical protein [Gammaproteobacteria bacterium]